MTTVVPPMVGPVAGLLPDTAAEMIGLTIAV